MGDSYELFTQMEHHFSLSAFMLILDEEFIMDPLYIFIHDQ